MSLQLICASASGDFSPMTSDCGCMIMTLCSGRFGKSHRSRVHESNRAQTDNFLSSQISNSISWRQKHTGTETARGNYLMIMSNFEIVASVSKSQNPKHQN
jgi:hypothetical protein